MSLSGKPLPQRAFELNSLKKWMLEHQIGSFLEIGSRYGDTLYEIAQALPKGSKITAVDLIDGLWGRSDSGPLLSKCIDKLNSEGFDAQVIFGDSRCPDTIAKVKARQPYDLILIDGDHRLEGVTFDWENYRSMGRYIAFHDIDGDEHFFSKTFDPVDVPYVWRALKMRFKNWSWIDPDDRGMGIGVLDTSESLILQRKLAAEQSSPSL